MWNFRTLDLENVITYKKAHLDLDAAPLTIVRGRNMDAGGNPNAAGKSVLLSCLPVVMNFNPPMAIRKNSAGDMHRKGSLIRLVGEEGSNKWQIEQKGKGKGVAWSIQRNDRDLNLRTAKFVQEKLAQIFPWNADQFGTLNYLNAFSNNILLRGTGTARHDLFENIFEMSIYDEIYEKMRKKLNDSKDAQKQFSTLKNEVIEKVEGDPVELKAKMTLFAERLKKRGKIADRTSRKINLIDTFLALATDMPDRSRKIIEEVDLVRVNDRLKKIDNNIDDVRKLERAWEKFREYQLTIGQLTVKLSNMQQTRAIYIKEGKRLWNDLDKRFMPNWASDYKIAAKKASKLKAYAENRIEFLDDRQKGLKDSKGACLVCGAKLSDKGHAILHKKTAAELKWLDEASKVFDYLSTNIEADGKIKAVEDRINDVEKVEPPKEQIKLSVSKLEKMQEVLEKQKAKHEKELYVLDKVGKLKVSFPSVEEGEKQKAILQRKLSRVQKAIAEIQEKNRTVEFTYYRLKEQQRQQKKIQELANKHKKKAKLLPVYEALAGAYGPRGLRIGAIRNIAEQYVANLNDQAPTMFAEKYTFSADIKNRDFGIMVERAGQFSDVRYLSGAESRAFTLLSLMALLPLLPSRLRSSLVVLDEMETGLSKPSRQLFLNEFLPQLNRTVPNIFVLTALSESELYLPHSRTITAVRKNNVTRLEMSDK